MQHNFTNNKENGVVKASIQPEEKASKVESKTNADQLAARHLESTFAEVHLRKDTPVQSEFEKHLPNAVGKDYVMIGAELEKKPDYDDKTKINIASIYTVRVTSKRAWLPLGTELRVKIKDQEPIFSKEELQDIMFGVNPPVVVTFDDLSHYHYGVGETLSAKAIHKTGLTVKEAMNHA